MSTRIWGRFFSVISGALGAFALYYGAVTMLFVPGYRGEPYLDWFRVVYGIGPLVLSVCLLSLAGWLWNQSAGSVQRATNIQRAFLVAIGLVGMFWVILIVIANLQGRIP